MTVVAKPLAGILQVYTCLPLQFVPLTIELSLIDNLTHPIIYRGIAPTNPITPGAFLLILHLHYGQFKMCKLTVIYEH